MIIRTFLMILIGVLYACSNSPKSSSIQKEENIELFSTSIGELEKLKGVNIVSRGEKRIPSRINIIRGERNFVLPIIFEDTPDSVVLNEEWYDVMQFTLLNNHDSSDALNFTKTYTNEIYNIFSKSGAYEVWSDPNIGNFVVFKMNSRENLVYRFNNEEILSDDWSVFFSDKKNLIEGNWYREQLVE